MRWTTNKWVIARPFWKYYWWIDSHFYKGYLLHKLIPQLLGLEVALEFGSVFWRISPTYLSIVALPLRIETFAGTHPLWSFSESPSPSVPQRLWSLPGWLWGLPGWLLGPWGCNGRMDGRTDGRMDRWMDGRKISPFYRTSFPIRAAAQK